MAVENKLREYRSRRDFCRTRGLRRGEPKPHSQPVFVISKHDANVSLSVRDDGKAGARREKPPCF